MQRYSQKAYESKHAGDAQLASLKEARRAASPLCCRGFLGFCRVEMQLECFHCCIGLRSVRTAACSAFR